MRAGFEGGQMPLHMRLGKLRGNTSRDAMPVGPFRTVTQGVNVRDLERVFDAGSEVTPELLKAKRLIRSLRIDVKILGQGDLSKKLTVSAHGFSKSAREKIEGAGGSITWLRGEPKPKPKKVHRRPAPAADEVAPEAEATPEPEAEAEAETAEPTEAAEE
jgi:large subunit ribosomal protein L15